MDAVPLSAETIERLRQERLQQLREARLQRRYQPPQTELRLSMPRKGRKKPGALSQLLMEALAPILKPEPDQDAIQSSPTTMPPAQSTPTVSPETFPRKQLSGVPSASPASVTPFLALPTKGEDGPTRTHSLHDYSTAWEAEVSQAEERELTQDVPPIVISDTGNIQRTQIGKAALILTGAFIVSRLLGLLRTSLFAFVFGTSTTSDAYLQAFLIPDLIFNIVAGGALSSAFIPVFTQQIAAKQDEKTAWHIASSALNLALALMSGLAVLAIIFARQLVPLYNPGVHDAQELDLIAALTRIMLLQAIALGAGVIITSILNARQDFRLPAIGTVLYNGGLILGLLPGLFFALSRQHNDQVAVYAATWGVVLGALLQVGIQIPGLRRMGMRYTPVFDWRHPGVLQIARQMVPRVLNAAMLYVSIFVDRGLIQLLVILIAGAGVDGLITQYYQAWQLVLLPLGIFGMAVSTAAFPTLAEHVARGHLDRVRRTIIETLRAILFLSIPSSIGLIILGFPIIQVLLQHGRYSLQDAQSTAIPLACFAIGLSGLAAVEILTRSFYAMRDSITPVMVSIAQFLFKIVLSLLLIRLATWGTQWGMGALAFSTSLAGLLEAIAMFWLLHRRIGGLQVRAIGMFLARVLAATLAMGLCLLLVRTLLDAVFVTTLPALQFGGTILALGKLVLELFVGIFVYVRAARLLKIEELRPLQRLLDRLKVSWI